MIRGHAVAFLCQMQLDASLLTLPQYRQFS